MRNIRYTHTISQGHFWVGNWAARQSAYICVTTITWLTKLSAIAFSSHSRSLVYGADSCLALNLYLFSLLCLSPCVALCHALVSTFKTWTFTHSYVYNTYITDRSASLRQRSDAEVWVGGWVGGWVGMWSMWQAQGICLSRPSCCLLSRLACPLFSRSLFSLSLSLSIYTPLSL